jgi:MarR family transcriptional regulator, organic hydroperoxide resistance regulator
MGSARLNKKKDKQTERFLIKTAMKASLEVPDTARHGPVSYFIFRTARAHRALAANLLKPLNLYPGQEILLMCLWDQDKQTQIQLIDNLELDASTVTKMVQKLELQGLVTRTISTADARAMIVALSPQGLRLKVEVEKMWNKLESTTLEGLTAEQRKTLRLLLGTVIKNLAKSDPS